MAWALFGWQTNRQGAGERSLLQANSYERMANTRLLLNERKKTLMNDGMTRNSDVSIHRQSQPNAGQPLANQFTISSSDSAT